METVRTDVVIAGAGPVGLLLAAELRLRGTEVIVLEQLDAPSPHSRAFGLHARSTESLRLRGLLGRLERAAEQPTRMFGAVLPDGIKNDLVPLIHFAGIRTLRLDRMETSSPGLLGVAQSGAEAVLADWAAELGVRLRRGQQVTAVTQDSDGVTVTAEAATGPLEVRARYLVGCDGGRSAVRKLTGFAFPGSDPTITGRLCETLVPELLADPGPGWHRLPGGVLQVLPGRILSVEFDRPQVDRELPVTVEEFTDSLERITGRRIELATEPTWLTRFTDNSRLAEHYRLGRVLLAGDAAHVHSPFGGQGLNLGLQDAMNLGWKLAAAVAGRAPEGLLDSYQQERQPVAARVLHNTRAQVALMNPSAGVTPLRELFADLMELEPVNRLLAELLSGVSVRYQRRDEDHPLTGTFLPDLRVSTEEAGECSALDLLADGRPLLLDFTEGAVLRATAHDWADRVRPIATAVPSGTKLTALLVRPDGYLAWATQDAAPDEHGLREALSTWFGPAR
ncbi:FAD-dependent monooxygenase [Kitasatospora sp. NBC_01266]|uniref:FAD-dependent monooxygenase n=1 Tax=Kitasatospora sp. NBC_01266 TaxID=2903572 RepID=UPI002E378BA2|nr:FAD-dependent monooxygenase [Kitasatospora sp. NBC_01266]